MRKSFIVALLFAAGGFVSLQPAPAAADAGWEVCAHLYREGGYVTQCDFRSFDQCKATTGNGGTCYQNPQPRGVDRSFARLPARR